MKASLFPIAYKWADHIIGWGVAIPVALATIAVLTINFGISGFCAGAFIGPALGFLAYHTAGLWPAFLIGSLLCLFR